MSVCDKHGYILSIISRPPQALVIRADTGDVIAAIGRPDRPGDDNEHFREPVGIACDEGRNRIIVSDSWNYRLQLFDLDSFRLLESIKTSYQPGHLAIDQLHNRIFLVGGGKINILTADTLLPAEPPNDIAVAAYDVSLNDNGGKLLVADYADSAVIIYDLGTLSQIHVIGSPLQTGLDNEHFNGVTGVTVDVLAKNILVADQENHRIQVFSAVNYEYISTIDGQNVLLPRSVVAYDGKIFISDTDRQAGFRCIRRFGPLLGRRPIQSLNGG